MINLRKLVFAALIVLVTLDAVQCKGPKQGKSNNKYGDKHKNKGKKGNGIKFPFFGNGDKGGKGNNNNNNNNTAESGSSSSEEGGLEIIPLPSIPFPILMVTKKPSKTATKKPTKEENSEKVQTEGPAVEESNGNVEPEVPEEDVPTTTDNINGDKVPLETSTEKQEENAETTTAQAEETKDGDQLSENTAAESKGVETEEPAISETTTEIAGGEDNTTPQ